MKNAFIVGGWLGLAMLIIFSIGCSNEPTEPSVQKGAITMHLTDAPAEFDAVNITFSEVSAHIDSDWVTIQLQADSTVNLLNYTNGRSILLAHGEVPAGHYTQVRLKIKAAEIVVDGQTFPLAVPSGAQSGLKFGLHFTVNPGASYELVIDFDVNRSIVVTGPKNDPKSYKLKPCLRVVSRAITGSISGTVTNPIHSPIAYAIQQADTVTSTAVDTSSGYFLLAFLPTGEYTVVVEDTLGKMFRHDAIFVQAGTTSDLGKITLQ
ncbi:MAG: DUF4382 domain-containing protein [candidate division KSB1 bacterium]|nr:DUF4382 domain-containing protein [candidate division KSB1 bacterium]MDZ7341481.1 DUF4382 domain-containing protein [candidate division KSB1 bacterium]